ncbi:xanthine dehydrogenase family protein molybdopterin-binding subunit [Novosphingobium sp. G106]|uniref:xanthine dehydrogenase family protein molybdopterin-binding subunit n=1 Tax=Novosphingobium sp. G106 TaxID=2849500 RepID=UPI001C2DC5A3|nr:xanthine dehydrogenase family protein molybdopterin-binding subunit [Novosphingobium sp. G106]MBV1688967.1 xanthine dehydrogenase family protein molybdopterin-binding subunit [Novosphingobium sp. G106]
MNASPTGVQAARFTGQRIARKEDRRLLTGRGTYVADITLAGMLDVAFVRSEVAKARIRGIDLSAARTIPGVHSIFTIDDLEKVPCRVHSLFATPETVMPDTPLLAKGRVAFVGDPIVMIIAENRYIAEDAASLVMIDYEIEDPVITIADAASGPLVHPELGSNVGEHFALPRDPEIEAVFAAAAHVVVGTVRHQRQAISPMETRGVVASRQGVADMIIHLSCQSPQMAARYFTMAFNLPETQFRVISKDVGGAFGLKVQPGREECAVVAASYILSRPVRWIEDRLENLTSACQAREQEMTVKLAFDKDARLLAADVSFDGNAGAWPTMIDAGVAAGMYFSGPYRLPKYAFEGRGWYSNTPGLGAYRGPWLMETIGRETVMDKAARQIGIAPEELRRRNVIHRHELPLILPTGISLRDVTPAETLEQALEATGLAAFRTEQAAARAEGRYLGLGMAVYIEPTTMPLGVMTSDTAQIRIEPTGKVTAVISTHSQGHGTETTMAQLIADTLGVPMNDVTIHEDDSSQGGFGVGAGGSRQAVAGGGASLRAADILKTKVKRIAAHMLNANPDDIYLEQGMARVHGVPETEMSLVRIANVAYFDPDRLPADMDVGLEVQYRYRPPGPAIFSNASHVCICEVDIETGQVSVLRWITSEDCGNIINPAIVEGQIAGGIAQGIGGVLLEEICFDSAGNPTTVTFKDYLLPTLYDVPEIEFHHIVTPSASEGGFKGVGEGGAIIAPAAVINAVADALSPFGIECLELPLSPPRLVRLIDEALRRPAA